MGIVSFEIGSSDVGSFKNTPLAFAVNNNNNNNNNNNFICTLIK